MRTLALRRGVRGSIPLKAALFLTLGRIALGPIFLICYLNHHWLGISITTLPFILLGLLLASEISDILDGFVARKFNQVTELGKILDPMADSIARISVFLTFTQGIVRLPLLLVFVFLYRDVVISMLRTLCALRGFTLAARMSGKIKAVLQGVSAIAVVLLMIPTTRGYMSIETLQVTSLIIISVVALYTLYSGFEYIYSNRSYISKAWKK